MRRRSGYAILLSGNPSATARRYRAAIGPTMDHLFFLLTLAAYLGSFACYVGFLMAGREWSGRLATLLVAGGLIAHYYALLERSRGLHTVPYHDLSGSMSLFGWLLALTYLS